MSTFIADWERVIRDRVWERSIRDRISVDSDKWDAWQMAAWIGERYVLEDCPPWEVMSRARMYRLAFWRANDVYAPGD